MKWLGPPERSPLWIRPDEKPVEYVYSVQAVPERPAGLETRMSWASLEWCPAAPKEPERVIYLGALEWTWSPAHSRFDSYYLSFTTDDWLIYLHEYYDGMDDTWEWYPYAASPKVDGDIRAISFWLVHDLLKADSREHEVDHFHLVSAQGLLSVGDFKNMGELVWAESEEGEDWDL
jgi:hypothetical protein